MQGMPRADPCVCVYTYIDEGKSRSAFRLFWKLLAFSICHHAAFVRRFDRYEAQPNLLNALSNLKGCIYELCERNCPEQGFVRCTTERILALTPSLSGKLRQELVPFVIGSWSRSQTISLRFKTFGKHILAVLSCLSLLQTCSVLHLRQCTPMYGCHTKLPAVPTGSSRNMFRDDRQPCCAPFVSSVVCLVLFSFVRT
jgi:hypothetical protein